MPQPATGDWHLDAALQNISLAFVQDPLQFIAHQVFPNVGVGKRSDKYHTFGRGDFARNQAGIRAPNGHVPEGGFTMSSDSYFCEEKGLATPITDAIMANADPAASPEIAASNFVTEAVMIEKEVNWASSFFATSIWATDVTPANLWSDFTLGDPLGDIRLGITTVLQNTGRRPNTLTMGRQVWDKLVDHPDITARITGGSTSDNPAIVTKAQVAAIFELDQILVGEASQNTAAEGDTDVFAFILGKNALLSYRPPAPGIFTASAGYTFSWDSYLSGSNEFGFVLDVLRDAKADSDIYRARSHYDYKVVSSALGYFFNGAVA